MPKKQRKSYTPEFHQEAVRLVTEQVYTYPEAAERLGVPFHSLKNWVKKMSCRGKGSPGINSASEAEELKRLRKENQRLQMEVAILRKAMAYFAKESL